MSPHRLSMQFSSMHPDSQRRKDTSWDTPYIHGVDHEANDAPQASDFGALYTVHLEDRKIESTPSDFLKNCWTNGLDTPCIRCREEFDLSKEPPVRLLGLAQYPETTEPLTDRLPQLVVKNYHLRCLKADQVQFFPVSHPWHSSVAEAYALRTSNLKAAQTCYEAPIRTLLGMARRFGRDHMLWHDYISIPQWQNDFRGTVILPQIFKIFEASGSAIIHLGRQPPVQVVQNPTLKTINDHSNELQEFFQAHLFTRLWPIVETDRAGDAYIMSNEYEIMEPKFSVFVKQIKDAVGAGLGTTMVVSDEASSSQWLDDLPLFIQERQKSKCLGYVYDMIVDLGCRSFRDKFIGASELLGVSDYPTELPKDTQDACLWLSEQQIKSNDLSPLLLRPSLEPTYEKALWLKGHQAIQKNMWGWGTQTHPAAELPQLDKHAIHLSLHLLGNVVHNTSWNTERDGDNDSTPNELLTLLALSGGSTTKFLEHLGTGNIAAVFPIHSQDTEIPMAWDFNVLSSEIVVKVLGDLLARSVKLETAETSCHSLKVQDKLLSLLALSTSLPKPNLDHFQSYNSHQLQQSLCDPSERNLVSISCPNCLKQSRFRVNLWKEPGEAAQLYLIPGLTYQYSAAGGTGVIMEEGQIIGRGRFCAPTCGCNRSMPVEIA